MQDISERRRLENALRESEAKTRAILKALPALMFIFSREGKFLDFHSHKVDQLWMRPEDFLGRTLSEILPAEVAEKYLYHIRQCLDTGRMQTFEHQFLLPNRGTRLFETRMVGVKGENKVLSIVRDVTERRKSEQALRESEEKYRLVVENATEAIFIGQDWLIKFPNPSLLAMFGYSEEDIASPSSHNFIDLVHPEERETAVKNYLKRIHGEEVPSNYPYRLLLKSGKELHIELNAVLTMWEGKPATLNFMRDVTERKRMEAQLLQAQKMEAVGTLAGGIAHDFNNILSAVIGYTELALQSVEKGTELEDCLIQIRKAGTRAADLTKQILTFARKSKEGHYPTMVSAILEEALKLLRSTLPASIEIRQNIKNSSLIMADPSQVHQVIMNLCTNAYHAMEDRGGVLEVDLRDVRLDTAFTRSHPGLTPGDYLKLSVSDTGTGISPDIIGLIFDPYFTTKKSGEGTGLGLAMVHGIVKGYGGEVTVESEVGKGTLFTVYLPIIKKLEETEPYRKEELPSGTERILFVDDESAIATMFSQVLGRLGYRVTALTDSIAALELFRSKPQDFDMVISDVTMPHMKGDLLAAELLKIRRDIPIILCTGYSKQISPEKAAKLGAKALAMKPITTKDLARTIRKVLEGAKD
jgi:PAS domain S-box-containing protein